MQVTLNACLVGVRCYLWLRTAGSAPDAAGLAAKASFVFGAALTLFSEKCWWPAGPPRWCSPPG